MLELIKKPNYILMMDSYKATHWLELPTNARYSYSAVVPRKPSKYSNKIVAMGQTFISAIDALLYFLMHKMKAK